MRLKYRGTTRSKYLWKIENNNKALRRERDERECVRKKNLLTNVTKSEREGKRNWRKNVRELDGGRGIV